MSFPTPMKAEFRAVQPRWQLKKHRCVPGLVIHPQSGEWLLTIQNARQFLMAQEGSELAAEGRYLRSMKEATEQIGGGMNHGHS